MIWLLGPIESTGGKTQRPETPRTAPDPLRPTSKPDHPTSAQFDTRNSSLLSSVLLHILARCLHAFRRSGRRVLDAVVAGYANSCSSTSAAGVRLFTGGPHRTAFAQLPNIHRQLLLRFSHVALFPSRLACISESFSRKVFSS